MRGTKERSTAVFHFTRIRWSADQNKPSVAIAAIDRAALVNLQPDLWVAKRGWHICTAAVTGDTVGADKNGFWHVDHVARLANATTLRNDALY